MRFFLVGTDRNSATLRFITDTVFESRRDALAYLSSDSAAGTLAELDEEVYVVDLDAATPVLLVRAATGISDAADVPQPEVAEPLAGALRRATGTLEAEGIVAPESAGLAEYPTPFVPEAAAWPWDSAAEAQEATEETVTEAAVDSESLSEIDAEAELDAAIAAFDDEAPVDAEEPEAAEVTIAEEETAAVEIAVEAEPVVAEVEAAAAEVEFELTEVEPEAAEVPEAEPAAEVGEIAEDAFEAAPAPEVPVYTFDALEEPAVDHSDLVPAPVEDAVFGRTVVMGEYGGFDAADESEPAVEESVPEAAEEVVPTVEEPASVYAPSEEAAGIETCYTCDDCVYVNTCPKHHDADPSSCGSFQWRVA